MRKIMGFDGFLLAESGKEGNKAGRAKSAKRKRGITSAHITDKAREYLMAPPEEKEKWTVRDAVTGEVVKGPEKQKRDHR